MQTGHRNGTPLCVGLCLSLLIGFAPLSVRSVMASQDTVADAASLDDAFEQRLAEEAAAAWNWNPAIPRPAVLADWGIAPSDMDRAKLAGDRLSALYREHFPEPAEAVSLSAQDLKSSEDHFGAGQRHLDAGRTNQAIASFRSAARLNPNRADIWAKLGHALNDAGNAIAAKAALQEAVARESTDFATLLAYGQLASRFRDDQTAAAVLLRASEHPDRLAEPGAESILAAELGACLLRLGHLDAGSVLIANLADMPDQLDAPTRYRRELDQLFRSRRSLFADAAQASFAVGAYERTLALLRRVESLPGSSEHRQLAALSYVLLSSGRPAIAAEALLNRFAHDTPDAESFSLLEMIAEHSDIGPLMESRLRTIAAELPKDRRERARQSFTLARSVLHSRPADRLVILMSHLESHPADMTVLSAFLCEAPASSVKDLLGLFPMLEPEISGLRLALHEEDPEALGPIRIRRHLREGRFEDALELATPIDGNAEIVFTEIIVDAMQLAHAGQGEDADRLLDKAISQASSHEQQIAVSRALLNRGRFRDALRLLDPILSGDQTSAPLRLLALHIAALTSDRLGDSDEALRLSDAALEIDPLHSLVARHVARMTESPAAIARLRDIPGTEADLLRSQAQSAMAKEQFDLAERLLLSAWERPLADDGIADMLAGLWLRSDSLPRAEQWLIEQSLRFPDRERLAVLLSRIRAEDRRPDESLNGIATALASRPGSEALSREMERILREDLGSEDRWLSQARNRLAGAPRTFGTLAEQSEVELLSGDILQSLTLVEFATDLAPDLRPIESRMVSSILEEAAREIVNSRKAETGVLDVYERVFERLDQPTRGACLGKISIVAMREFPSAEELTELATRAGSLYPDIREEAFIYAAHSVMVASRGNQSTLNYEEYREVASEVYAQATRVLTPYPSRVLGEWIDFAQVDMDFLTLSQAIRSLGEDRGPRDQRLRDALTHMLSSGIARQQANLSADTLADAAHQLAFILSINNDFETASVLYEEALRIYPDHIETNNSYGYRLLTRGEQTGRAIRMIERAYTLDPNTPHIVDSMGWARYKQGRFTDEVDPESQRVTHGAITILRRARSLAEMRNDSKLNLVFTIDHLGDALWANGQREEAIEAWQEATNLAEEVKRSFANVTIPISIEVEIQDLLENAMAKSRAANEDRPPPIAPYQSMPEQDTPAGR